MDRVGETEQAREVLLPLAPVGNSSWTALRSSVFVHFRERDFDAILESVEAMADLNRNPALRNRLYVKYVRAIALAHGAQRDVKAETAWRELLDMSRNLGDLYRPLVSMHAYAGLQMADSLLIAANELRSRVFDRPWMSSISSTLEPNAPWVQDNPSALFEAAVALTRGGLYDEALDHLEDLSELTFRSSYSHSAVLDYVYFDPLHDNPRFQALVANWDRSG